VISAKLYWLCFCCKVVCSMLVEGAGIVMLVLLSELQGSLGLIQSKRVEFCVFLQLGFSQGYSVFACWDSIGMLGLYRFWGLLGLGRVGGVGPFMVTHCLLLWERVD